MKPLVTSQCNNPVCSSCISKGLPYRCHSYFNALDADSEASLFADVVGQYVNMAILRVKRSPHAASDTLQSDAHSGSYAIDTHASRHESEPHHSGAANCKLLSRFQS